MTGVQTCALRSTAEQLDALYTYCRQASQPPGGEVLCWAAFWRLLANTGLRRREALQLKWADITPDQLGVRANRGDRIRARVVPISQGAREAILEIRKRTGNTPFVFPRITGPELSAHFALQARESGIGGTLAWLRHSFIAHLVMQGLTLTSVQQLAGHAAFATTERYAYLGPDSAITGLDDLLL